MVNSHGRFVWYELVTTNIEATKAFYANVVGWGARDVVIPGSTYSLFTVGNDPVAGVMNLPDGATRTETPPHWIGYVEVDDVDVAVDQIKRLGGAVRVAPTNIPEISRFSVVADPQMATLALVKGLKPVQAVAAELNAPGRVGWHELLAADLEKAFAFYGAVFGWQKAEAYVGAMGRYQHFSGAGKTIGAMFTMPAPLPLPFWLYYFNVDDVDKAAERAEAGGGKVFYGPTDVPGGGWIVHCTDPQGAVFALLDKRGRKPSGYFISGAPQPADSSTPPGYSLRTVGNGG